MIELFMPVMRPDMATLVLEDLAAQTTKINAITIVDNGGDFKLTKGYPFMVKIFRPNGNIGTNAVWNLMFNSVADFVGIVGDDYRIEYRAIEGLLAGLEMYPDAGAVTATIFKDQEIKVNTSFVVNGRQVIGRGNMGLALFRRCTLDCIPEIPEELFVFYGDNWFGYWLLKIGHPLHQINVGISHYYKRDLFNRVGYKQLKGAEHRIWEDWKKELIEL